MKVLAKEPAARYRTADQLGRVLMTFGQAQKSAAVRLTQPPPVVEPPAPTVSARPQTTAPRPIPVEEPEPVEDPLASLDWISVGLGLVALAAVGGLIPWWFYVIGTLLNPR